MLTTIEQLEQELEEFHKTIASSNELVRLMKLTIDAVTSQNDTFNQQSSALEQTISQVPIDIKSDYDDMLSRFSNKTSDLQREVANLPAEILKVNTELADKLFEKLRESQALHNASLERLIMDFTNTINAYRSDIEKIHDEINTVGVSVEGKYSDFLSRLETLNITQIYELCKEISKKEDALEKVFYTNQDSLFSKLVANFNQKMISLYIGAGVIIVLLMIILIVK